MERDTNYDAAMAALRKLRFAVRTYEHAEWVRDAEEAVERLQGELNLAEQHADYLECELRGRKLWPIPEDEGMKIYPLPEARR